MLRFAVLIVLFAAVWTVPISDEAKSTESGVIVVNNIDEYLAENPESQLGEMEKVVSEDRRRVVYTFGRRIKGAKKNRVQLKPIN